MKKTLHQFGRVLFDELEQVAVRRGGFASLMWVEHELDQALRDVKALRKKAADPNVDLSSGCYLRLMTSVNEVSYIPAGGGDLIIVAAVDNVLHFRILDSEGNPIVETDEKRLTKQEEQIEKLRRQFESLLPPHELTASERGHVITAVTSIVGQSLPSVSKRADKCARGARAALSLATQAAKVVEELGLICARWSKWH